MRVREEEPMSQPKVNKQAKRRAGLSRLRLRLPPPVGRATRSQDLGDLRLQFLLDATHLSR
jgi:hypothetical protein